jgi:hypothetical protein
MKNENSKSPWVFRICDKLMTILSNHLFKSVSILFVVFISLIAYQEFFSKAAAINKYFRNYENNRKTLRGVEYLVLGETTFGIRDSINASFIKSNNMGYLGNTEEISSEKYLSCSGNLDMEDFKFPLVKLDFYNNKLFTISLRQVPEDFIQVLENKNKPNIKATVSAEEARFHALFSIQSQTFELSTNWKNGNIYADYSLNNFTIVDSSTVKEMQRLRTLNYNIKLIRGGRIL